MEVNKMGKAIYQVMELNVDGCGGNAAEFVAFSRPLCRDELDEFCSLLDRSKKNRDCDEETADIISDALNLFGKVEGELCHAPYEGTIEF